MIKKLQTSTQIHQDISNELQKINIDSVMRGDYDSELKKKNMKIFKTNAKKKSFK